MNIVTGCSGIDAIAYTAMLLDIEVIGQIEIDEFCNQILKLRYPKVKRLQNVFDVRGDEFGTVDIFGFGDPCQPHSVAGKQKGTADERYIWPEIFRIIQVMRPTWIINENVVGSVSNGVVRDKIMQLESEGYRAQAFTIPACAVGAPHERERVFIVANTGSRGLGQSDIRSEQQRRTETINSVSSGFNGQFGRESDQKPEDGYSGVETMADSNSQGLQKRNEPRSLTQKGRRIKQGSKFERDNAKDWGGERSAKSGMGGNADGLPDRLHGPGGQEDSSGISGAFEEIFTATLGQILWPAGYGAEQHPWEPPRVAAGVRNRTNRLKSLGNSIVWQQIFSFLLAIKLIEEGATCKIY